MSEYRLDPTGEEFEARLKVENTTAEMRHLYRNLRRSGFSSQNASLVVWGFALCAGDVAQALGVHPCPRAYVHPNRRRP